MQSDAEMMQSASPYQKPPTPPPKPTNP